MNTGACQGDGALVIGAGYLARFLADCLPPDTPLIAVRRTAMATTSTTYRRQVACDVLSPRVGALLAPALRDFRGAVFCLLPPSALESRPPVSAFAPLFEVLRAQACRRVVLASSTGIYDEDEGAAVTAETPITAVTPRARRLHDIEQTWMDSGLACHVIRLAGLYGPGRIVGRETVRSGAPLPGDPQAWLNLVRAEDAVAALLAAARQTSQRAVDVISDGRPLRRQDYYGTLASVLGCASPPFDRQAARRGGSRRIDPTASWQRLGIAPHYRDIEASLRALLADEVTPE